MGPQLAAPQGGLGSVNSMRVPSNHHRHPDNKVNTRNSATGAALYPERRLGTQEAESELRGEVGGQAEGKTPGPLLSSSLMCFPNHDLQLTSDTCLSHLQ